MKKRGIIYIMFFITSIYFISAITVLPTSFSIEVYEITTYNVSVNNTNLGQDSNITEVKIIIPDSFTFVVGSYGTDALFENFRNTSTTLIWTNSSSSGYLINGSETKYFWFRANASTLGDYNITIVSFPGPFVSNIPVSVSDTTLPSISFEDPTPGDDATLYINYLPVNVTASDNAAIDTIVLKLYNSTGLMETKTSTTSPLFYNFTNLDYGTYRIDADVNDSFGNTDSTSRRTIKLDFITPSNCTPDWNCTAWSNNCSLGEVEKERTCTDLNNCGNDTGKPYEIYICPTSCTPNWNCTEWLPEECTINETQTRTCTDLNNCGVATGKPSESQSCTYEKSSSTIFIIIVIVIILIIAGIVFTIFYFKSKKQPQEVIYQQPQSPSKPL